MSKYKMSKNVKWGGYLDNNKLTSNKKYIVLLLIFLIGFLTIYINTSYGLFKKKDYLTSIDFVAGTLDYKIESDALTNNSITVPASGEYKFDITLTSLNSIDSKYELYYLIDGAKVTNNDIQIGYTSDSKDSVKGIITADSKKNITVRIKNNSSKSVEIFIGCEGGLINNELILTLGNNLNRLIASDDIMLAYTYIGENNGPTKFPDSDDGYYVKELTCTGGTAEWDNNTWTMKIISTTDYLLSCNASLIDTYRDDSGANIPEVASGMIPVIYDGESWIKADTSNEWYNYDNQWWANAVTVSTETRDMYTNLDYGEPISMDDINTMWVWIPRYEYEAFSNTTATEIKINFLQGTNGSRRHTTHQAFEFGDKSLTGIWVAKFSASSDTTCVAADNSVETGCDITSAKIKIKPNEIAWRGIRLSTLDLNTRTMNTEGNIYGFNESEIDIHVMKNMEWGAVAYLSHSKYGKYGNPNYEGSNKEIYQNKSSDFITGMSNGTPGISTTNKQVTYDIEGTGTGASTTGNIYGIYDMSGPALNYVMAGMKSKTGENIVSGAAGNYNSGFTGLASGQQFSGRTLPDSKYYDLYVYSNSSKELMDHRYKKGDATYETNGWYGDIALFIFGDYSWFVRGGFNGYSSENGIFGFTRIPGNASTNCTFRPVLLKN